MESSTWKPSSSDYLDALQAQNPWHRDGTLPEVFRYPVKRLIAEQLWRVIVEKPWRYQVVLGPRRVGKTVTMYQTIQSMLDYGIPANRLWFMRMDHPLFQDYPLGGWVKALIGKEKPTNDKPLYLFLDEVNYAKDWDLWLKTFYDEKWPVQVVATSSSAAALRDRHIESGVGRWSEQYLTPYNYKEYLDLVGITENVPKITGTGNGSLRSYLRLATTASDSIANLQAPTNIFTLVGGFPEILDNLSEDVNSSVLRSQQTLRSEAIQRVTGMDLPQAFNIRQPLTLERLLYLLAGQMCGQISTRSLANTLDTSHQTVSEYINYLEQAFLVFTLCPYSKSEEKIQRRGRKIFFVDGALRNAALQRGIAPMTDPDEQGALIENLVASHLFSLTLQNDIRLFHWREKQQEVDLVYDDPLEPLAIEVTAGKKHTLLGLKALAEKHARFKDNCYLVSSQSSACHPPEQDENGVGRIPLETFLLATSTCMRDALQFRLSNT